MPSRAVGMVHLVGAGPGDPGLLTCRARELLDSADVVIHDALVSPEILATIPPRVQRIDVGKRRGKRKAEQDSIHALLVEHAMQGRQVVRLQGGDPMVFGRGGEEVEALREAGVPFEVVPGVSAAWAVPASVGIPLTHRDRAGAVTLVTGHDAGTPRRPVSWNALAGTDHTLVLFMGLVRLGDIAARLVAAGRSADTPVAVVQEGTTPRQRHVVGTLADIEERVRRAGLQAPALVVVGAVAGLADGEPRR